MSALKNFGFGKFFCRANPYWKRISKAPPRVPLNGAVTKVSTLWQPLYTGCSTP